jgi:GT2 family glycosyltransferase
MSRWAVVILNWNGRDDTLRCLAALRGADLVVVADNGSEDGSVEAIRERHPAVIVVENDRNIGFSAGNNAGIRVAVAEGADWVVLLNNDAVPAPDLFDELRAAARRHPDAGILAGKLLFPDGTVQWAGQRVGLLTGYSGRPRGYRRDDRRYPEGPVDRAVGALMAVSRQSIEVAGLLDEDLFAYVEDVDWSLRIRAAGFACVFVPTALASHSLTSSTGGDRGSTHTLYYGARNTIAVVERHRPLGPLGSALRRATIVLSFIARAALIGRGLAGVRAVLGGWNDARRGRLGERPER